jgi:hybrid polyketide synthase/nonribosomal peptide synthetase ACE1
LTAIEHHQDQIVTADFSIYSCPNISTGSEHDMELMASRTVKVSLGNPGIAALSCTLVEDYNMSAVDPDRFYAALSKLGYGYSGSFRGMSSMKRRLNQSSALVDTYVYTDNESTLYLVHPSMLDVAFNPQCSRTQPGR